jgi:hypothetical protein
MRRKKTQINKIRNERAYITQIPTKPWRKIQVRCKNSVKGIVKFIREGISFQQTESELSPE